MSPTYTMSAHLCKQIYSSWRQARQTSPDPSPLPSPPTRAGSTTYLPRSPSPEKQSIDSERSEMASQPPLTRQPSGSNWRWGSR
ncbi:hypothetical protein C8A03DRAFT_41243 [Achaetomium macrosporum]|uniref:Uncharacterized protein n=1 Tax=Achaetomium macrosporum TaxID=79813 RepID=A0AAN7CHQ9_9PEZI|nr:hypothetical protein C8A03DRAFT_41243 [Achaetomium macrosporum]